MTNTLWLGANLLFDTETGKTTSVFLFVFHAEDATVFTAEQANSTVSFVESRAFRFAKITWSVEPSPIRKGYFVIRGEQHV